MQHQRAESGVDCMSLQASLKAVSNLLLRNNSELRQLYDLYSCSNRAPQPADGGSPAEANFSFALTQQQMWQLLRDCAVPDADLSMARIDQALQQVSGLWVQAVYADLLGPDCDCEQCPNILASTSVPGFEPDR